MQKVCNFRVQQIRRNYRVYRTNISLMLIHSMLGEEELTDDK